MHLGSGRSADETGEAFRVPDLLPLFPLPNVVFFPKTYLPLHVFEPRYREMLNDAERGERCIGMVLLKEGWEENYYGNPPIFDVGCAGRLISIQRLPDGRANIVLQGCSRFQVREQFYDRCFRRASVELKDCAPQNGVPSEIRERLFRLLESYTQAWERWEFWQSFLSADVSDEVLINTLCTYLDLTPLEKQLLLEADSISQRARRLADLIQLKLCVRDGAKGCG